MGSNRISVKQTMLIRSAPKFDESGRQQHRGEALTRRSSPSKAGLVVLVCKPPGLSSLGVNRISTE